MGSGEIPPATDLAKGTAAPRDIPPGNIEAAAGDSLGI